MSATTRAYPSKQPFPSRTAMRIGREQDQDVFESAAKLVTYQTPPYAPAHRALEAYLRQYTGQTVTDGMTLGIYGPYGSGKTHLVQWLRRDAAVVWRELGPSTHGLQQVYAKVDTSDFLYLYRTLVRQIDRQVLQDINAKLLSKLAQKEVAKSATTQDLVVKLQRQPQQVFELLRNTLISESDVKRPQSQWVRKITGMEDFLHFTAWLSDPSLGEFAAAWLQGEELSENTLSRMGIKGPINTRSRALAGLSFLISIFAEVRCPLLLYIDQAERLLPAKQPDVRADNAAVIQSLAEWAQDKQAFLCVAGATKGSATTADLPGRFSVMVGMPGLESNGTANLLKAYLDETGPAFEPYASEADIYPYTFSAIEQMVPLVNGSIRGILRLAFQSYEIASQTRDQIGPEVVQQAFRKFDDYFDKQAIVARIKELLAESGFSFKEEASVAGGPLADLAVFDGRDPAAYIEVVNAIFDDDEARSALDFTKLAQAIRASSVDAKLILIVAGYLSPQVQSRLADTGPGRTVDHYIVYAPDRFEDEFRLVLQALAQERQRRSASASSGLTPVDVMGPIEDLKTYFEKVLDERLGSAESRQQRIASAAQFQASADKIRSAAEIEKGQQTFRVDEQVRADKARIARKDRENQERERLRSQGEEERKRRAIERACWFGLAVIVVALLIGLAGWKFYELDRSFNDPRVKDMPSAIYWLPALMGLAASGLAYAFSTRIFGLGPYSRLVRFTRLPVPTLTDLDDLAIRLGRSPEFDSFLGKNQSYLTQSLSDPNPQVRYAAARILELGKGSGRIDLFRRVRAENWIKTETVLLRVLTRAGQADPSKTGEDLLDHFSYATAHEALYIIDALSRLRSSTYIKMVMPGDLNRYPSLVLLHAIFSDLVDPSDPQLGEASVGRQRFLLEFALAYVYRQSSGSPGAMLGIFLREHGPDSEYHAPDFSSLDLQALSWLRVEEAMAVFGPGGAESLGDYEDLAAAKLYRQIYDSLIQVRLALFELV